MNRPTRSIIIALLGFFLLGGALKAPAEAPYSAFVSILPQAFFVERIAGEHARVHVLVTPGKSPATYEPTPKQMAALADSRIFFRIGVPFERSIMPKIRSAFKELKIVDTSRGIKLRSMASVHDHHGSHDHHGAHDHHGNHGDHGKVANDPHIWLDPLLVKKQASVIADGLIEIDPKNKSDYQKNLEEFNRDLDQTHKQIADSLKGLKNREIFVFHPAYGYFCDRYGLKQIPVEIEGKQPSPKQLADLIEKAKSMNVRVIFVQPQFDESSAQTLAEAINGAVVSLNPLARDYLNNLKDMARKVEKALKEQGGDQ